MTIKYYASTDPNVRGLFEAHTYATGAIGVSPQGGGFVRMLSAADFAARFHEVQPNFSHMRGTVTADFLPEDMTLPCLGTFELWNGWGMPFFERAAVDTLLTVLIDGFGLPYARWSEDGTTVLVSNDAFDSAQPESEANPKFERFASQQLDIGGETLTAWPIGDGWTWDAIDFEGPKRQAATLRIKDDILKDVLAGLVPRTIEDFSDLQSYVDANMYGGFGDESAYPEGWTKDGQMKQEHIDFINACQELVCQWIKSGGVKAIDGLQKVDTDPAARYYRVKDEMDAAGYTGYITDNSGTEQPADPETGLLRIVVRHDESAEVVGMRDFTGRAGLTEWYVENVGHNPDEEQGGPVPILELLTSVALHMMYRAKPEF